eukprot:1822689-Pleurochrysis_carterae.AAC.1
MHKYNFLNQVRQALHLPSIESAVRLVESSIVDTATAPTKYWNVAPAAKIPSLQTTSRRPAPSAVLIPLTTRRRAPSLALWRLARSNPLTTRRRAPYLAVWRLALSNPFTTRRRAPSLTPGALPCPPFRARCLARFDPLSQPGALRCPASPHPAACAVPFYNPAPCAVLPRTTRRLA